RSIRRPARSSCAAGRSRYLCAAGGGLSGCRIRNARRRVVATLGGHGSPEGGDEQHRLVFRGGADAVRGDRIQHRRRDADAGRRRPHDKGEIKKMYAKDNLARLSKVAELSPKAMTAFRAWDKLALEGGAIPEEIQRAHGHRRRSHHTVPPIAPTSTGRPP